MSTAMVSLAIATGYERRYGVLKRLGSTPLSRGGLLAAVAPELLYFEDGDGDGRADRSRTLYTGFALENIQQLPSSLQWGLDNWVYACVGGSGGTVQATTANVDGWKTMPLTDAAQAVQVSAFPDHYAKWETHATNVVLSFYGEGPYAHQANTLK